MAKLKTKLGRRLKNPFKKQASASSTSDGSDERSVRSSISVNSGTSSLNSDVRDAGPIDADTCRKYKRKNKNSQHQTSGGRGGSIGGLTKIAENRATTPNFEEASTSIRRGGRGRSSSAASSRSTTPVSQIDGRWTPPLSSQELALKLSIYESNSSSSVLPTSRARSSPVTLSETSPGAESVSTINGQDVFERSRSASLFAPFLASRQSSGAAASAGRSESLVSEYYSSLANSRSVSPSVLSRVHDRKRSDSALSESTPIAKNRNGNKQHNNNGQDKEANVEISPTSVHMFGDSEYPVEINPVDSQGEEEQSCSSTSPRSQAPPPPRIDGIDVQTSQPPQLPLREKSPFPRPPTPHASKKKTRSSLLSEAPSAESSSFGIVSPPRLHRISPSKMFNDACESIKSTAWDPLKYTSLEDAVAAHAAMLTNVGAGSDKDSATKTNNETGADAAAGSSPRSRNKEEALPEDSATKPEFLALKKDTEKNEFKKATLLSCKEATKMTLGEPQEVIELQALDTADLQEKTHQAEKEKVPYLDPPGVDATNTRSTSPPPTLAKTTAFPEDVTSSSEPEHDILAVDVIQSFSFDQDLQYSLSDDSLSYHSEMESIGEITICEETTRLLEAHKLYDKNALTNENHPSRQKKSIMKVGSKFRQERSSLSMKEISCDESVVTEYMGSIGSSGDKRLAPQKQRTKLSWYDDERNWDKPFTLRTDESFDETTVTTKKEAVADGVIRYNVVDHFFGDFIKEIGKYANCGVEEDVASFDPVGEQEI